MNELQNIKEQIEKERKVLDRLAGEGDMQKTYQQSLIVDKLMERYLELSGQLSA